VSKANANRFEITPLIILASLALVIMLSALIFIKSQNKASIASSKTKTPEPLLLSSIPPLNLNTTTQELQPPPFKQLSEFELQDEEEMDDFVVMDKVVVIPKIIMQG
jgi:hypothetical protein